jgi:hypothetical protein
MDKVGTKSTNLVILSVIHHYQNSSESTWCSVPGLYCRSKEFPKQLSGYQLPSHEVPGYGSSFGLVLKVHIYNIIQQRSVR